MPVECQRLMCSPDSPIIDFYPEEFELDLNGKKFTWQAVALLPWIDEKRLLENLAHVELTFSGMLRAASTRASAHICRCLIVHPDRWAVQRTRSNATALVMTTCSSTHRTRWRRS